MSEITFDKAAELFALATLSAGNKTGVLIGKGLYTAWLIITAVTGTTPTLDVHLEESDDNSSYTDVVGGVFPQKNAVGRTSIRFQATKKYLRVVSATGGTTPVFTAQVLLNPIP
jgi:hypothetical protein